MDEEERKIKGRSKVFVFESKTMKTTVTSADIASSYNIDRFLRKNGIPYIINETHSAGRFVEYQLPDNIYLHSDTWMGTCEFINTLTGEKLYYREM